MTKNEALTIGWNAGLLSHSKQITLGTRRALKKVEKRTSYIREELKELEDLAKESSDEEKNEERAKILSEEYKGEPILLGVLPDFLLDVKSELVELTDKSKIDFLDVAEFIVDTIENQA